MKKHLLLLIASCAISMSLPVAPRSLAQCGTEPPGDLGAPEQRGGYKLPTYDPLNPAAQIVINAIVVFVDFPDDNTDPQNDTWPTVFDTVMYPWQANLGWTPNNRPPHPALMSDIIDASMTNPSPTGKKWNITTYFRDMSYGTFNIIGHVVYQQARYPFSDSTMRPDHIAYSTDTTLKNNTRGWVTTHVIEDVKSRIAANQLSNIFLGSDSWSTPGPYIHSPGNDNIVDLVIVLFRNNRLNHSDWNWWTGLYPSGFIANPVTVYDGTPDSALVGYDHGVYVQGIKNYPTFIVDQIWHEIGHVLGLGHQYGDGMWSVMMGWREGFFTMNSWERWKMGWLNFYDYDPAASLQGDGDTLTLSDLVVHPQAVRIKLPHTASSASQYFFIEHHRQSKSNYIVSLPDSTAPWYDIDNPWYAKHNVKTYDIVDDSVVAPGLYILYDGYSYVQGTMKVVAADGRWNWIRDGWALAPWSSTQQLPLYKRGSTGRSPLPFGPNPDTNLYYTGNTYRTDRQMLDFDTLYYKPNIDENGDTTWVPYRIGDYIWAWRDWTLNSIGSPDADIRNYGRPRHYGDGHDGWGPMWNNMFSPWSNPNTNNSEDSVTNVAVQIVSATDSTTRIKLWFTNPVNGPPAKPQNLRVDAVYSTIDSAWHPMLTWEKNLESDVDSTGKYWIERYTTECCVDWISIGSVTGNVATWTDTIDLGPAYSFSYRIRAQDAQSQYSVYSEPATIEQLESACCPDPPDKRVARTIVQRNDASLHVDPNPAATETQIIFSIPQDGAVTLRLFDLQGHDIAWLVDDFRSAGTYTEYLPTNHLPPGTYVCVLQYRGRALIETLVVVH